MQHKTSGLKIATYLNIFLGAIFIAASLLIVIAVNHSMRKEALANARAKTHLLLERNMATHHYFSSELKPKLFEKIDPTSSDDYFEPTWMSSTYAIRQIDKHFKSFGQHEDYYYKECAVDARSPQNEANDYEKAFIAELNANPDLSARSETRTIDDEKYYVTLHRGEMMEQACIRCHDTPERAPAEMLAIYGPERSFGRKAGDVVSAVSIRIPLVKAFAATKTLSIKLSGLLIVILSVIFTMQFFFTKWLIQKPLGILQNKSSEISFDNHHLGEKLSLPRGKELRSLVTAFNNMSTNLRHNRDTLQEQVENRTAEIISLTQQYKELVENTDNFIARVDKDGTFLYVNQTSEKILGLPPEECIGLSAFDFIHPDDLERTKHIFATRLLKKNKHITLENRQVSRSGQTRHMLWTCTSHFDESGKIAWIDSIAKDITERKAAENTLHTKTHALNKRIKELGCLYGLSKLIDKHNSLEAIFKDLIEIIPPGWQYPEITCCRIIALGNEYKSSDFERTQWQQSSMIFVDGQACGSIEVFYKQNQPEEDEGPFVKEERDLINALTERLSRVIERKQAEEALKLHELRLEIMLKLNKMIGATEQEILDFVREAIIEITDSDFAFICFVSEDELSATIDNWSKKTMAQCRISDKPAHFIITDAGIWADAVRQRKPVVINDYASLKSPSKKGCPQGHIPLKRLLTVPIFDGDRITIVAGIANKTEDYDNTDIEATTSMLTDMWRLLQLKRVEEQRKTLSKFPSENPNPVMRFSNDGTIIYANDASSVVLDTWQCQVGEQLPEPCRTRITDAFASDKVYDFEFTCNNGQIFSVIISPTKGTNYANLYGLDITDRKCLEEQKERLSKLVQTSKEAVNIISADRLITYTNESMDKLFGYEKGELLGQNVNVLNSPSVRKGMVKNIIESINKKGWWEGEIVNIRKDGTEFISSATINANKDSDENILSYNTIQHDITEIRKSAKRLEIAKEQAEAANIAKSHFLANMSHEIRTPMSVILGFTELLANKNLPKDQADHVELIQNAGKGLLQVINDVLDVSKIEAGKLDINMTDCSLNKILDDIKSMMKQMAIKKGLQFNILKGENIPTTIHTDHDRLAQCLVNLISNAIKFTEKGHVHLKVSLDTKNNSLIRFDVEDTGIGIEPGKLQSVFESFTQVDNTYTRQQTGTGLGLTITKRLTELLGGTVSVSSQAGKGSVFSLVMPTGIDLLAQAQIQQTPSTSEIQLDANTRQFNGKVLIAEDYEGLREYAKTLLQSFGMKTTLAADGQEAVKTALSDSFDLILMDLRMPNMDGYQAVKELRNKDNKTPIIAVTAHAMRGYKKICLSKGFDDYISKPIDRDQMSDILDKYLPAEKKA